MSSIPVSLNFFLHLLSPFVNSVIHQVRRTTRVARSTKDNENANAINARARVSTRTKSTAVSGGGTAAAASSTRGTTGPTIASKAKTVAKDVTAKETTGTKRKREALSEVTTLVTNNNTVKGKETVAGAGVGTKAKVVVKPTGSKTGRVPLGTVATRRERPARVGSESTTVSTKTDAESILDSRTGSSYSPVGDVKMDVDVPLPSVEEEKAKDGDEARRVFKKRHKDLKPDNSQVEADKVAAELQAAETTPDIQLWDDLDADDWDDPLMVSEYVVDVCEYLKEIEVGESLKFLLHILTLRKQLATMPRPDYMEDQSEITWENRGILIDWLLQVHAKFGLLQESLFLTVNLIDRFLGMRAISLSKLQLVGLACFFIATKYEETYAPSVKEIANLAEGLYSTEEILKAEKYILKTLEWDLRAPGPLGWLRRGSKADDCEVHARTVAKYLIEIACLERKLIGIVPSLTSAAALWLARLTLGREVWVRIGSSFRAII